MIKAFLIASLCISTSAQLNKIPVDSQKSPGAKKKNVTFIDKIQRLSAPRHDTTSLYSKACFSHSNLRIRSSALALFQEQNVPGAGIAKFKPFEKVLKDGFLRIGCIKDYMYNHGDKYGKTGRVKESCDKPPCKVIVKESYKLGPVSNVSIVHYSAFVDKLDQAEMTHARCFEFCRTVPNMGFFGIVNGHDCYCTPYFTAMESDSSKCDITCEGDSALICGGKTKSSIFAMHMCDSTEEDLKKAAKEGVAMLDYLTQKIDTAHTLSDNMDTMSTKLQKSFGAVGDSGVTDLMQQTKVFSGLLRNGADKKLEPISNKIGDFLSQTGSLSDFTKPSTVTKAERIMEGISSSIKRGDDVAAELVSLESLAIGEHVPKRQHFEHVAEEHKPPAVDLSMDFEIVEKNAFIVGPYQYIGEADTLEKCARLMLDSEDCQGGFFEYDEEWCYCTLVLPLQVDKVAGHYNVNIYKIAERKMPEIAPPSAQYYPVMYFVDKKFEEVPTTCNGELAAKPITGQSVDGCAAACNSNIHKCIGFQHFKDGNNELCFLFSKFRTGFYYTGCGHAAFLQSSASVSARCYAKTSKFEGSPLKPDSRGTCKQCFKQLTKADRCY